MDCKYWIEKYKIDCRLKYNSVLTQKNYISQVTQFLYVFEKQVREPKEIPTEKIKLWLLEVLSPNTRNHRLCAIVKKFGTYKRFQDLVTSSIISSIQSPLNAITL